MSSQPKHANLLIDLGLAALSGSAIGALISKFPSIAELQAHNPRLYEMLIGAGVLAAHEAGASTGGHDGAHGGAGGLHQLPPPGFLP